jgi:hypothetical protein
MARSLLIYRSSSQISRSPHDADRARIPDFEPSGSISASPHLSSS